ncbi:4Fe-4S single cluster domain-containing protein [Archangium violaceum]|uniref:4Fe-4S single cluster domain-containing protein n=1 Tax=Archangium violaceum TaxID=83451 RepID=UPI002B2F36B6|nr:4Fe-4S single cluster domain-containing protein [Archangium gephyra]
MTGTIPSRPLNVARWLARSAVNGPGERFVLWLQGCGLACPGCWNPDTWSFASRQLMTPDELMALIQATPGIEGVTFTGGEPFAQAAALVPLARRIRAEGLSLVVFTGHEPHELQSPPAHKLLSLTDVLITGRFVLAERDLSLTWRGSRNQNVLFLTPRYSPADTSSAGQVELHLDETGTISLTGFPPDDFLDPLP